MPANVSGDLTWQLIRHHNSFMVKRNGITLSREPGNLLNKHSYKFSGLANKKSVDVAPAKSGRGVTITMTKKSKSARRPAKRRVSETHKAGVRRVAKALKANVNDNHYRPDLTKFAIARAAALINSQKQVAKPMNASTKKSRSRK